MKKMVIALFILSISLASGNIQKQMDDLIRSLQNKYQISGPEDLYKLKTQEKLQHGRTASRDMGELVGDWRMEEEDMEVFVTVGSDQSILDIMTLMAMEEADGSIAATASDYVTELTYLFEPSIMEGGDGGDDCDISCEGEYNDYNDYGMEPSDIYCECCEEDWPLDDICENDDDGDGGGIEFQYNSVTDLYADYISVLESMGTGCDGCTGNLENMVAVTSFDIAIQSEFENWANNYEFFQYYFQFIDENENDTYDSGEIYALSCEGDDINMTVAYDGSVYELSYENFWMDAYDFYWGDDDDPREDTSRNYDALTFAQDYVNDNSSDWGENAFDLESEFSLVVDGDYVSGGLGGDDPGNCEINWPEDPYKIAVYSFVSEFVLYEGGSVGCFTEDFSLDQTYADATLEMEQQWTGDDDDNGDDDGPDLLIMNMDLMEFMMVSFGMDLDSLSISNPTTIAIGSSNDNGNIDMVTGLIFDETGVIELMADSVETIAATSIDTINSFLTITNLNLYDSTGAVFLTVNGSIGPGSIEFQAGIETSVDFSFEDGQEEDLEFYLSLSEGSTGMDIEIGYDDYYGEEYSDTSYFNWSATTDSLFLYFESDYYYEDEADTMALGYMIIEDTLFASASFNPCEDDGYESYEECFGNMDLPYLNELVDVESFRVNQKTIFTSTVLMSVEPTNGELPEEFKLYASYPNPFNPVTTIRFDVGITSPESTLRIYDVSGRNVTTLISGQLQPGSYEVQWDATNNQGEPVSAGVYLYKIQVGKFSQTNKMILLK